MNITVKNKYFIRSRISEAKFRKIMRCFSLNLTTLQCIFNKNTNTVSFILQQVRIRIAEFCELESIFDESESEIEMDDSDFVPNILEILIL